MDALLGYEPPGYSVAESHGTLKARSGDLRGKPPESHAHNALAGVEC